MSNHFDRIIELACNFGPMKIAVAAAEDEKVLEALKMAVEINMVTPILIGDKIKIQTLAEKLEFPLEKAQVVGVASPEESAYTAAHMVSEQTAQVIMKGRLDTAVLLKAVLDKQHALFQGGLLSHVGVLRVAGYDRFFVLSDSAMNIQPTLEEKVYIIRNAVRVAHVIGLEMPKVAMICPVEKVNPKIPATIDAEKLTQMNQEGMIVDCIVRGPLALDNAISKEAAMQKGIDNPVAGCADVLIPPDLSSANILNKAMEYFGKAEKAGIIMGAKMPIILTSRASSARAKLNSIALGMVASKQKRT